MLHIADAVHEQRDRVLLQNQPEPVSAELIGLGRRAASPGLVARRGRPRAALGEPRARSCSGLHACRDRLVVIYPSLGERIRRDAARVIRIGSEWFTLATP